MNDYIELHTHSYFSLLDGASSPEDLVQRAAELGMSHLALTDHDAFYGIPSFIRAARRAGIQPIVGAELTLHDKSHLTLLVRNETGYRNLSSLITAARHNAPKGEALLSEDGLESYTDGLIALSGCRLGAIPAALRTGDSETALQTAKYLKHLFGKDHFWIELQHHQQADDNMLMGKLVQLADQTEIGVVATNNVHYASLERHALQDVLVCMHHKTTLDEADTLRPNSEYYLKSGPEMTALFAGYPQAIHNTRRIAEQCQFELPDGIQTLPQFPTPGHLTADQYLRHLSIAEANRLGLPDSAYEQLDHELKVIQELGLSNYYLIVWDMTQFSRSRSIGFQVRGSGANSLVAYVLHISPINPLDHNLVFERFLSPLRKTAADFDIDFDNFRRDEITDYLYQTYGSDCVAIVCTFVTIQGRSAIRDIGKALGLPIDLLGHITTTLDTHKAKDIRNSASIRDALGERIGTETWQHILNLSEQIDGFPRHLGVHNGGMVITGTPTSHRVPTEPSREGDHNVIQWDKEGLADARMVKIDVLGLAILAAITETLDIVERSTGHRPNLGQLMFDDPAVYDMICAADTVGVFQVESRAQAQVLPRLKPRSFSDLMVCISLIRPGPVQGNMVHPYLNRRDGIEPVIYLHPLLEEPLKDTLGIVLFQEQCLLVAHAVAGFSHAEGEMLRRAFGAKRAPEAVDKFHQAFIEGALAKGVESDIAEKIFDQLRAFASYSFAKSHAACFAVLVYQSAWLKHYHPAAFAIALLNNQPMGFWSPAIILSDIRRHNIPVYPVDVNRSQYKCTPEGRGIRLGINYVRDFGEDAANRILDARQERLFARLEDFCHRVDLPLRLVENLIAAGAMDSWGKSRRDLLWAAGLQEKSNALGLSSQSEPVRLPVLNQAEKAGMEYDATGLSMGPHPLTFYRQRLQWRGILNSQQLSQHPTGEMVWTAGLMVVHQSPPTAKGYHFITLEDEYGFMNLIIRPKTYVRFRRVIRSASLLLAKGQVQREGAVTNLIVERCIALNK